MGFNLTENQQKIVDHIQGNLLVAAGAGSGKTAVLTQHIAKRVLDDTNPVDIDQMLVLTYTKSAAAEMKGRIRDQLEKKLEEDPDNAELRRQLTLLPTALVCTIDSFCQKVLKEQFFKLDLDPGFKVADDTELELLKNDIIRDYFEELYTAKDEDFITLVNKFGKVKGDDEIVGAVKNIIKIALAEPDPAKWMIDNIGRTDISWTRYVIDRKQKQLRGFINKFKVLRDMAFNDHLPQEDISCLENDISNLSLIADYDGDSFDTLSELYSHLKYGTYKKAKPKNGGDEWDNPNIEVFGKIRDGLKNRIKKLQSSCAEYPESVILEEERQQQEDIDRLLKLSLEVYTRFQAAKSKENQVDFADMEQMTWKLFIEDGNPTETAREYSERFAEILIDEYQDCNKIQEDILAAISRQDIPNRFMVGDVKQSIYGFRKARPDIFVGKYNSYRNEEDTYNKLIELRENFRSSVGVINGINTLFSHMMISEMGDIDYANDGCINPDPTKIGEKPDIEIHILDSRKSEEKHFLDAYTGMEKEAYLVASKIHTMVENGTLIIDRETGEKRPMRYGDVAVLLRSVSKNAPIFVSALKSFGISAYSESESGYYDSLEVANTLDYLAILDNPYQDVRLLGVLKSGYCNFSADELAAVHLLGKNNNLSWLYDQIRLAADLDEEELADNYVDTATVNKARDFIRTFDRMRERSVYLTISELITELLDATGFMYYSLALPGGKKRVQNLRMLQVKAENYEQTRYRGIFQFLRYVDQLKSYEMDIDTPSLSEGDDSVVIMTIHKSKGLEFPVCFVSGATKGFSNQESRNKIQQDDIYGIGMDIVNDRFKYRLPSFKKACILDKKKLHQKTEEQRLLYVAMTRARDRLIITGSMENSHDYFKALSATLTKGETLDLADIAEAKNYLDWIAGSAVQVELTRNNSELSVLSFNDEMILSDDKCTIITKIDYYQDIKAPEKTEVIKSKTVQIPISEEIGRVLGRKYLYENEKDIHAIYTVSELKKTAYVEPDGDSPELGETRENNTNSNTSGLTGADRGNAYHHFMEELDFAVFKGMDEPDAIKLVNKELEDKFDEKVLNEEEKKCINPKDIVTLLQADIGKRMIEADISKELFREQEFVYACSPSSIPELNTYGEIDEQVLIQGIVDAVFYENGKWIIIDYKTDNMKTDEEFINRYKIQLKYYKEAWEDIKGEEVSEGYLYSFRLGRFIKVF